MAVSGLWFLGVTSSSCVELLADVRGETGANGLFLTLWNKIPSPFSRPLFFLFPPSPLVHPPLLLISSVAVFIKLGEERKEGRDVKEEGDKEPEGGVT